MSASLCLLACYIAISDMLLDSCSCWPQLLHIVRAASPKSLAEPSDDRTSAGQQ